MNLYENEEFKKLKLRVNNAEKMIQIFWSLLKDLQPPSTQEDMTEAVWQFYEANEKLGADFSTTQFEDELKGVSI